MHFGIWTPLPHTIRPEPRMERALAEIKAVPNLAGGRDGAFDHACDGMAPAESDTERACSGRVQIDTPIASYM
jgi:FMNH2-dependent dimethyl sulfone monooxygenase